MKQFQKVNVLGVNISKVTMLDALKIATGLPRAIIYTPNPEICYNAYRDKDFRAMLNEADLLLPDGIGVVNASKKLGNPLPERVSGFDFFTNLIKFAQAKKKSIFLFGAKEGIAQLAKNNLERKYRGLNIAGTRNGYFEDTDEEAIVKEINASKADILAVCLGSPKQEEFIHKHKDELKPKIILGLGGSIDVLAGVVHRAPAWFRHLRIEWLYRALADPKRMHRLLFIPHFLKAVSRQKKGQVKSG